MKNIIYINIDIGEIGIAEDGDGITDIFFKKDNTYENFEEKETAILIRAKKQIIEYFNKKRKVFDIPISLKGTEFQKSVWNALLEIPYGKTQTYKQISEKIGKPKAYRAVGMANNRNPIAIIIPCHRVIGCDGSLIGYAGGIEVKRYLLNLENISIK